MRCDLQSGYGGAGRDLGEERAWPDEGPRPASSSSYSSSSGSSDHQSHGLASRIVTRRSQYGLIFLPAHATLDNSRSAVGGSRVAMATPAPSTTAIAFGFSFLLSPCPSSSVSAAWLFNFRFLPLPDRSCMPCLVGHLI